MKLRSLLIVLVFLNPSFVLAISTSEQVGPILAKQVQSRKVVTFQLQEYLQRRVPSLPKPASAAQWTAEAEKIRERVLSDVVYHGWPKAWVDSPPDFQVTGEIPTGQGYRLLKMRYEIVPGFYSTALLYEPQDLQGKVPAVLNVMGHYGPIGKANVSNQTLCINEALRGMITLNLEWIGEGELSVNDDAHWFGGQLDLVGANDLGLFYLAMRRGIDYLYDDPHVDRSRIAVTGLSGGGWQTIVLSSLDKRVDLSIPVAGYTSLEGRLALAPITEAGDLEQNATDFIAGQDYSTLTAMRAPRPTLLINNAQDNCCFRAPLVKPYIFEAVKPFFGLYGKEGAFQFYENTDISAHNYGPSNRRQAYRFFAEEFHLSTAAREIPVGADIRSYSELAAGVPKDNLTILGLARKMAAEIQRPPIPTSADDQVAWARSQRAKLEEVVRYHPASLKQVWAVANTLQNGVESVSFRFLFGNGLSATAVWLKNIPTPPGAPLTIVLNDEGTKAAGVEEWDRQPVVSGLMDRGNQVLVLDLLFTGDAAPDGPLFLFPEMLAATGNRPIGMEAAQLIGIAHWARVRWSAPKVSLVSTGIRSQVESLVAAALEPHMLSEIVVHNGMRSLSYLLTKPVSYLDAPDMFCLDLYKDFDLDRLEVIAAPTKISASGYLQVTPAQASEGSRP